MSQEPKRFEEETEDDLSLKEILDIVKDYVSLIWKRKFIVVGMSALVALAIGAYQYSKKPIHIASVDFMINENEGGGSGIGSILGQFGMGGDQGGAVNQQKVILIAKSFPVLSDFLLDSIVIDGHSDLVAAHIIRVQELSPNWSATIQDYIQKKSTSDSARIKFNGVMKSLISYLKNESSGPFFNIDIDKKTGVMHSVVNSRSAELSVKLSNRFFLGLSDRYIMKTTSAKQRDYDLLTHKKDSIYSLLVSAERRLATSNDRSNGMILQNDRVSSIDKRRKVEMYTQMYVELVTRQQTAEYMLLTTTPVFETLEVPFLPIGNSNGFEVVWVILGFILTAVLLSLGIVGIHLVQNFMEDNLS